MPRNRIVALALAPMCGIALGGCYFASGINYDEPAYRHRASTEHASIVELHARPWHTGNAHMPFDFTVYRYDETYELVIPGEMGHFGKDDITLRGCGVPLVVVGGSVDVTRDSIKFDIEYGFKTRSTPKPIRLVGSMRLVDASAPPKGCTKPHSFSPTTPTPRE